MDLSSFEPARPAGLEKPSPEAEALNMVARALGGTSVTKMAGSFSQPVAFNHDQLFVNAQSRRPQASPVQISPVLPPRMRQTRQGEPTTFLGTMADQYMARIQADRQEHQRQEREDRIRGQRQGRQPQAEPQRQPQPEYSAGGQYTGPDTQVERGPLDITIGQRPAQSPWGIGSQQRPTFPVGMSPEDMIHQTAQKSADDLGIGSIYRGRQGQTRTPGTTGSAEDLDQLRKKLSGEDYETFKVNPEVPGNPRDLRRSYQPDVSQNVSNGQFGALGQPNGKPRSDAFTSGPSLGRDVEKGIEDIGKGALDAGELGA